MSVQLIASSYVAKIQLIGTHTHTHALTSEAGEKISVHLQQITEKNNERKKVQQTV